MFRLFGIPQLSGERLGALAVLFAMFAAASLPLTYLLHFLFKVRTSSCSTSQYQDAVCPPRRRYKGLIEVGC